MPQSGPRHDARPCASPVPLFWMVRRCARSTRFRRAACGLAFSGAWPVLSHGPAYGPETPTWAGAMEREPLVAELSCRIERQAIRRLYIDRLSSDRCQGPRPPSLKSHVTPWNDQARAIRRSNLWALSRPPCQSVPSSSAQQASKIPLTTPHRAIRSGSNPSRSVIIAIRRIKTVSASPPRLG